MMSSRRSRAIPLLAALLAAVSAPSWAQDAVAATETARVIVKIRAGSSLVSAKAVSSAAAMAFRAGALGARLGVPLRGGAAASELAQVVLAAGVTSAELADLLAQDADVECAVPDERRRIAGAPNDPLYAAGVGGRGPESGQWYLRAPSGDVPSSLDIEAAWAVTTGSPDVVVAVVDTGVRYEHPDLLSVKAGGNLLPGYDMVSEPASANDGDGRDADASDPGDWLTLAELSQPGSRLSRCTTSPSSLSLGGDGACSAAYQEAVDEIVAGGTVFVAAAGNSSGHAVGTPANCRGVMAVARLRHVGSKVGFSSLGPEVAISAPGGNCVNTAPDSACLFPILAATDSGGTVPVGSTYTDSSTVPECTLPQYGLRGGPVDQDECYCTTSTCGAGMLDAGAALGGAGSASRERPPGGPGRQKGR